MKALRSAFEATGEATMSEEAMILSTYHGCIGRTVEDQPAIGLAAAAVRRERPNIDLEAPAARVAIDVDQVISRAPVFAVGRRRCRRNAQHGHGAVGTGNTRDLTAVVVAVEDRFAADAADHGLE